MAETATAPVAVDPKATSANIVKGVTDRAAGKTTKGPEVPADGDEAKKPVTAVDPNVGKRKFVVNGQEKWLTSEQADAYVQKGLAFEPRISELARLQQETGQFLEMLKTDPGKVIYNPKVGLTPEEALKKVLGSTKISDAVKETVGQWYYENVVKRAQMDERDRAILERDERINELTAGEKARAESAIAQENKQRVDNAMASLKGQIKEALGEIGVANIDTPLGVQLTKRIADVMRLSYIAQKPCTVKEAVARVRQEIKEFQNSWLAGLDDDKLVEELGKENAEKVRKHFLKVVKATEDKVGKEPGQKPNKKRSERETMNSDQFREYLDTLKSKK